MNKDHFIQVNIDTATDIVTFRSFKQYILVEPIDIVTPEITQDAALDNNPPNTEFVLTIRHEGHGMTAPGELILITGAISRFSLINFISDLEVTARCKISRILFSLRIDPSILLFARSSSKSGINSKGGGILCISISLAWLTNSPSNNIDSISLSGSNESIFCLPFSVTE
ncbi:MAG: hypothetical protein IIB08_01675 [Bacteroidetes bacterium]|nr:hypothetical protein [Bacteroidota bacterium]